jgi:acetyltransferase
VVTATGAFGIIAADACEDYGLTLAPFPETLRELEEEHIAWHKLNNPVDVWPLGMVTGSFMGVFRRAAAGLLQADDVDAVLGVAPIMSSPRHADLDVVGAVRRLSAKNLGGKPLALLLYGEEAARQAHIPALEAIPGVACFDSMDEAVMGLAALHRYQKFRQQNLKPARFALPPAGDENRRPLPKGAVLVGQAALGLVEPYGLAAVSGALVQEAAEAAARAGEMGYPVVLKIVSPEWLHKSDQGGVRLNLSTETELQGAFRELTDRFRKQTPGGTLTGILVQKQVQGVELLLGLKRDPQLGPVLLAGAGGIYTEILKDVTRGLVPVSREEARAMLAGLKIFPILQGARGQAGVNLALLEDALAGLSRLAADYPEIQELDLNPVMATAAGCWAVDCRVVT